MHGHTANTVTSKKCTVSRRKGSTRGKNGVARSYALSPFGLRLEGQAGGSQAGRTRRQNLLGRGQN